MCQRTKPHRTPAKTLLHPFSPPSRPWESITIDIIGPLPESQGFNAILVIVDQFSKVIKLEAITMELTSEGTARILRDQVFRDHRLPRRIVHDCDTHFMSSYTLSLMTLLGVQQNLSTAYHPQTDGQTERVNQDVKQYLRIFINYQQDNWKVWLSITEFSHNNLIHSAIGTTPFLVNTGQHPWTGQDSNYQTLGLRSIPLSTIPTSHLSDPLSLSNNNAPHLPLPSSSKTKKNMKSKRS